MSHDDDRSTEGISQHIRNNAVFREEYEYHKRCGHAHSVAERRAIDYYRKYTSREITQDWQRLADETLQDGQAQGVIDTISFNQSVARMLKHVTPKQRVFIAFEIVRNDLDRWLNDENGKFVARLTKRKRPEEVREMASCMGLAFNNIGVATPLTKMRQRIRVRLREIGFVPPSEDLDHGHRGAPR